MAKKDMSKFIECSEGTANTAIDLLGCNGVFLFGAESVTECDTAAGSFTATTKVNPGVGGISYRGDCRFIKPNADCTVIKGCLNAENLPSNE